MPGFMPASDARVQLRINDGGQVDAIVVSGLVTPISPVQVGAVGQLPGTATNDSAAAGSVGEIITATTPGTSHTVTITIPSPAAPGVVTWAAHGLATGARVTLSTTGALPTGLTAGTPYYVIPLTVNTFQLSATFGGAAINTSGTQSGTHTATASVNLTTATGASVAALPLTAGDWDVMGVVDYTPTGTTSITILAQGANTTTGALGAQDSYSQDVDDGFVPGANVISKAIPPRPLELAVATTVYLVVNATFTASTLTANGTIWARRRR